MNIQSSARPVPPFRATLVQQRRRELSKGDVTEALELTSREALLDTLQGETLEDKRRNLEAKKTPVLARALLNPLVFPGGAIGGVVLGATLGGLSESFLGTGAAAVVGGAVGGAIGALGGLLSVGGGSLS